VVGSNPLPLRVNENDCPVRGGDGRVPIVESVGAAAVGRDVTVTVFRSSAAVFPRSMITFGVYVPRFG